ncbi:MAG: beta-galactosidase trimerization domain-containing protein [Candidatus Sumerlaeota bacterium]|nr:beta-galactosidase trimerization domain-containing protein [Candidatus Sumerlaeota bacterium]
MTTGSQSRLDALHTARVVSWDYPADLTPEQADKQAAQFVRDGATLVLTENHRYIMYDRQPPTSQPKFLWPVIEPEASIRATRIAADACHRNGLLLAHHVTAVYCTQDYMERHRDWTQRDARRPDKPLFFKEYGGVWLLCLNNPGFREAFFRTVTDITRRAGVDGWMIDEVEWLPDWFSCGCKWCRKKFCDETGCELPDDPNSPVWENFGNPIWRAWLRFRMKSGGDFFADLKKRLDDAGLPGQVLSSCHAGAGHTWLAQAWGMDAVEFARSQNFIFYEAYIKDGIPFYGWRRHLAEMRLYSAIARRTGFPPLTLFYCNSLAEFAFCWSLCALEGHRMWAFGEKKPYFQWERDHPMLFGRQTPVADAALLFSKQTRDNYMGLNDKYYIHEWAGWAETLTEANIPHEIVLESDLNANDLERFRVLILPHAVCLSDGQIKAVRAFAARGGKVITTGETAARDETGAPRKIKTQVKALLDCSIRLAGKPGKRCMIDYARGGKTFSAQRHAASAMALLVRTVREAAGNVLAWEADATTGVVINVFRLEPASPSMTGALVIHVVNCTGSLPPPGTPLPMRVYPIEFPPVKNIRVRLRNDIAGTVARATLYSPDSRSASTPSGRSASTPSGRSASTPSGAQAQPLNIMRHPDGVEITIHELKTYVAIRLE